MSGHSAGYLTINARSLFAAEGGRQAAGIARDAARLQAISSKGPYYVLTVGHLNRRVCEGDYRERLARTGRHYDQLGTRIACGENWSVKRMVADINNRESSYFAVENRLKLTHRWSGVNP